MQLSETAPGRSPHARILLLSHTGDQVRLALRAEVVAGSCVPSVAHGAVLVLPLPRTRVGWEDLAAGLNTTAQLVLIRSWEGPVLREGHFREVVVHVDGLFSGLRA